MTTEIDSSLWIDESIEKDLQEAFGDKRTLRVDEVRNYLQFEKAESVRNLIKRGEVVGTWCGSYWRISRHSFSLYLNRNSNMNRD